MALGHLGYPEKVVVQGVAEDSPSEGALEEGDALESVDGRPTPDSDALRRRSSTSIPGGTEVTVAYTRLGAAAAPRRSPPGGARSGEGSLLGVTVLEQPSAPFDVDIQVEDVGGPSAGLMLTLGHPRPGRGRRPDRRSAWSPAPGRSTPRARSARSAASR